MSLILGLPMRPVWPEDAVHRAELLQEGQKIYREAYRAFRELDYPTAMRLMQRALALVDELGDHVLSARILTAIGQAHFRLRQHPQALEYHHQAVDIARNIGDEQSVNFNLVRIAEIYWALSQREEAKRYLQQALYVERERLVNAIKQALPGTRNPLAGLALDFIEKGKGYEEDGRFEDALAHYRQGLALAERIGDSRISFALSINIALVNWRLHNYAEAMDAYMTILEGQQRHVIDMDQSYLAQTYMLVGLMYDELGVFEKAIRYLDDALDATRRAGHRSDESYTFARIGDVHRHHDRPDRAILYYQKALALETASKRRLGEAAVLTDIGEVLKGLGHYEQAKSKFEQSLAIYERLGRVSRPWRAESGLAAVEAVLGDPRAAIEHYYKALDSIESLRSALGEKGQKLSFFKDKLFIYDELIGFLHDQAVQDPKGDYARQALHVFERKQGRIFLEQMGQSGSRRFAGLPEDIGNQERGLDRRVEALRSELRNERFIPITGQDRPRIQELEERLERLEQGRLGLKQRIRDEFPDYYALKYPQPATIGELQRDVLRKDEILLIYGVMPTSVLLWVITPDRFEMHRLATDSEALGEKVLAYRQAIEGNAEQVHNSRGRLRVFATVPGDSIPLDVAGHALYRLLVPASVRPLLRRRQLYVIPTGVLYRLPFEGLVTQGAVGSVRPRFLIEDASVSYLSSASLLKTIREAQKRKAGATSYPLLAFANPVYREGDHPSGPSAPDRGVAARAYGDLFRSSELRPLPETEDEAKAIADAMDAPPKSPAGVETLQLRQDATKQNLLLFNEQRLLDDYRYLLFAMHGVLIDVNSQTQPALAFSYPARDGYVTMADVFGLELNADLVMLSACNTGGGDPEGAGEGIRGLTGAFLYAGTPAVVVTLWSVETHSAKALSVAMFSHLRYSGGPAHALRAAKLKMIKGTLAGEGADNWRHPFYWTPFVLFGDAG